MIRFYSLLLFLILPYSGKCLTVTTLPPLQGYFFLNQTHISDDGTTNNCMHELWSKDDIPDLKCTYFNWNIDYSTRKTLQQWVKDQYKGRIISNLIFNENETTTKNDIIFVQTYVDADDMPILSKATYRRIGEHYFQWRFDPFYVSDKSKRIIVSYKRKTTCLQPYIFALHSFEQSILVESCSRFQLLYGFSTPLQTLEQFPLPGIPPINESDYKPIKKEDIPKFDPYENNGPEDTTTKKPEEKSQTPSSDHSKVATAGGINAPWIWAVLIICCVLLLFIIAFGSILLYLLYTMKPMIIFEKMYIPATVDSSVKSSKSKAHNATEDSQTQITTQGGDTKGVAEKTNAYDNLDLKTPKRTRSSKETKSGKKKKQKKPKSNPEPAWTQPSKPILPKKSRELIHGSVSSKNTCTNTSNASKDSIAKAYKGEINVDRSGKDLKEKTKTVEIITDENDKSKSNR